MNESSETNDKNCENCENVENDKKDSDVNKEQNRNKEKYVLNYKRVTVWSRKPGIYWRFNTLQEAWDFINKDEKLKDNFTMEVVTCRI